MSRNYNLYLQDIFKLPMLKTQIQQILKERNGGRYV